MYSDFLTEYDSRLPGLHPATLVDILMDEYEIDRRRAASAVAQWAVEKYMRNFS